MNVIVNKCAYDNMCSLYYFGLIISTISGPAISLKQGSNNFKYEKSFDEWAAWSTRL